MKIEKKEAFAPFFCFYLISRHPQLQAGDSFSVNMLHYSNTMSDKDTVDKGTVDKDTNKDTDMVHSEVSLCRGAMHRAPTRGDP